jgi:hypothetical protein
MAEGLAGGATPALTKVTFMVALDHLVTSGTFSLDGGTWEVLAGGR